MTAPSSICFRWWSLTINISVRAHCGPVCDSLEFWLKITIESFALFHHSVFDCMFFTVMSQDEVKDLYVDRTYVCTITKTCLYDIDPLKPHFYIIELVFTGVNIIFLISAQKHRLWVLIRTVSPRRF